MYCQCAPVCEQCKKPISNEKRKRDASALGGVITYSPLDGVNKHNPIVITEESTQTARKR